MNTPTIQDVEAAVRSVLFDRRGGSEAKRRDELFADRLLSLRHAEALPAGVREVRVAPGTVVTPLARDFLKQRGIALRIVARAEAEGAREPGEWGLAIGVDSGAVSALRRALLDEARPWFDLGDASDAAARWVAVSPSRGALLLAEEASVTVWRACRIPGVRAALACDVDAVDRAIRRLGVNLLVVEPAGKSISLMKQMSRIYRNAGAPRTPRGLEGEDLT